MENKEWRERKRETGTGEDFEGGRETETETVRQIDRQTEAERGTRGKIELGRE